MMPRTKEALRTARHMDGGNTTFVNIKVSLSKERKLLGVDSTGGSGTFANTTLLSSQAASPLAAAQIIYRVNGLTLNAPFNVAFLQQRLLQQNVPSSPIVTWVGQLVSQFSQLGLQGPLAGVPAVLSGSLRASIDQQIAQFRLSAATHTPLSAAAAQINCYQALLNNVLANPQLPTAAKTQLATGLVLAINSTLVGLAQGSSLLASVIIQFPVSLSSNLAPLNQVATHLAAQTNAALSTLRAVAQLGDWGSNLDSISSIADGLSAVGSSLQKSSLLQPDVLATTQLLVQQLNSISFRDFTAQDPTIVSLANQFNTLQLLLSPDSASLANIGDLLQSAIGSKLDAVGSITDALGVVSDVTSFIGDVSDSLGSIVDVAGTVADAVGSIGDVVDAVSSVVEGIGAFAAPELMGGLLCLGPVGAVAAVAVGIGELISSIVGSSAQKTDQEIQQVSHQIGQLSQQVNEMGIYLGNAINSLGQQINGEFQSLGSMISRLDQGIQQDFSELAQGINQGFNQLSQGINQDFNQLVKYLANNFNQLEFSFQVGFQNNAQLITADVNQIVSMLGSFNQQVMKNFMQTQGQLNSLQAIAQTLSTQLSALATTINTGLQTLYQQQWNTYLSSYINYYATQSYGHVPKLDPTGTQQAFLYAVGWATRGAKDKTFHGDMAGSYTVASIGQASLVNPAQGVAEGSELSYVNLLVGVITSSQGYNIPLNVLALPPNLTRSFVPSANLPCTVTSDSQRFINPLVWMNVVGNLQQFIARTPEFSLVADSRCSIQQMVQAGEDFLGMILALRTNGPLFQRLISDYQRAYSNVIVDIYQTLVATLKLALVDIWSDLQTLEAQLQLLQNGAASLRQAASSVISQNNNLLGVIQSTCGKIEYWGCWNPVSSSTGWLYPITTSGAETCHDSWGAPGSHYQYPPSCEWVEMPSQSSHQNDRYESNSPNFCSSDADYTFFSMHCQFVDNDCNQIDKIVGLQSHSILLNTFNSSVQLKNEINFSSLLNFYTWSSSTLLRNGKPVSDLALLLNDLVSYAASDFDPIQNYFFQVQNNSTHLINQLNAVTQCRKKELYQCTTTAYDYWSEYWQQLQSAALGNCGCISIWVPGGGTRYWGTDSINSNYLALTGAFRAARYSAPAVCLDPYSITINSAATSGNAAADAARTTSYTVANFGLSWSGSGPIFGSLNQERIFTPNDIFSSSFVPALSQLKTAHNQFVTANQHTSPNFPDFLSDFSTFQSQLSALKAKVQAANDLQVLTLLNATLPATQLAPQMLQAMLTWLQNDSTASDRQTVQTQLTDAIHSTYQIAMDLTDLSNARHALILFLNLAFKEEFVVDAYGRQLVSALWTGEQFFQQLANGVAATPSSFIMAQLQQAFFPTVNNQTLPLISTLQSYLANATAQGVSLYAKKTLGTGYWDVNAVLAQLRDLRDYVFPMGLSPLQVTANSIFDAYLTDDIATILAMKNMLINLDITDASGNSAVMLAVNVCNLQVANMLMMAGVNLNLQNAARNSVLNLALNCPTASLRTQMLSALVVAGAVTCDPTNAIFAALATIPGTAAIDCQPKTTVAPSLGTSALIVIADNKTDSGLSAATIGIIAGMSGLATIGLIAGAFLFVKQLQVRKRRRLARMAAPYAAASGPISSSPPASPWAASPGIELTNMGSGPGGEPPIAQGWPQPSPMPSAWLQFPSAPAANVVAVSAAVGCVGGAQALEIAPTHQALTLTVLGPNSRAHPADPDAWRCAALQGQLRCTSPDSNAVRWVNRINPSLPWEGLTGDVFDHCEISSRDGFQVRHCIGANTEVVELSPETPAASFVSSLQAAAVNGALSSALPEAVGDLLFHVGLASQKNAALAKSMTSFILILVGGFYLSALVAILTRNTLRKIGCSETTAALGGNAVAFVATNGLRCNLPGAALVCVNIAAGKVGLWAEKAVVNRVVAHQGDRYFTQSP